MSEQHLELLRRGYEMLARGEVWFDSLQSDVVISDHDTPDQSGYRGHQGFEQWLADWDTAWEGYTFAPEEFIDLGEVAVVVIQMTAKGRSSGIEIDREDAIVYTFRDGKIATIDYYNSKEQAMQAARELGGVAQSE